MNRWAGRFGEIFLYQRGRVAASVFLVLFAALVGLAETPARAQATEAAANQPLHFVAVPAAAVRQLLFDGYQRVFPRQRLEQKVAVVAIDEKSLKLVGQWPWPRDKLAVLVDAVAAYQPVAIGLDIYLPEPDQTSPEQVAKRLSVEDGFLANALAQLPSHDIRLAKALESAPTVLGAAGFDFETLSTSAGLRIAPISVKGPNPLPYLHRYPFVLASLPQLQAAARGQALVSVEEETVVRRIPLVAAVGDLVVPSLGAGPPQTNAFQDDLYRVNLGP